MNEAAVKEIVVNNESTRIIPLVQPVKRIIWGGAVKLCPKSGRSPQLKHVVLFRRQTRMILNNENENMKCFDCGQEGHVIHACPKKGQSGSSAERD